MRLIAFVTAAGAFVLSLHGEDAREIVRKSVELDQVNWARMKDYTWNARLRERHFESDGSVTSRKSEAWETIVLGGEPHRRMLERDGRPLSPEEQRNEEEKLQKAVTKIDRETPEQAQRRLAEYEKRREKEREFLRELPEAFDFRIAGEDRVLGHDVWIISATPKPGYQPQRRDAKPLTKIKGRLWVEKAGYQWVRVEAETTDTISFGLFIARLNPGAHLVFEQTRINDEVWLPKRIFVSGTGRLALIKKIAMDQEVTWSNYRKFHVDSTVVLSGASVPTQQE